MDGFFFAARELAHEWVEQGSVRSLAAVYEVMELSSPFCYQDRAAARAITGLSGDPVVLWTGNLYPNKDPLTILAGFERLLEQAPHARLHMAYRYASLLPQVEARIASSPTLRQAVTLLGKIPHGQIAAYYNSADLFVQGSAKEGSGVALLDALACGVVPIVTDIPSFRVLTDGGRIGALWPVGDVEAFTAALLHVAGQPLAPLSHEARRFFDATWSFPAIGRQAVAAYRQAIQARLARERGQRMSDSEGTAPGWIVRAFRSGDEMQVIDLFATCFGRAISAEHLRWKLHSRPSPVETAWLAEAEGRIIAHYAGIPVRLWLDGREYQAMVPVDGMVHPDFRRQGAITGVVNLGRQRWIEAGVSLGLLLPNEQWGSRVQAFGWHYLFSLQWRRLFLSPSAALARRLGLPFLARLASLDALAKGFVQRRLRVDEAVELRPVTEAGPEFDRVWQAVRPHVRVSLVRDRAWIAWRYFAAPSAEYRVLLAERAGQPVGYVAYRLRESGGARWAILADLFADPREPQLAETLLARAIRHLTEAGVESVASLAVPDTSLDQALRRAGFFVDWGAFGVHVVRYQADLPLDTMRDPQNWVLAGGDFDVV